MELQEQTEVSVAEFIVLQLESVGVECIFGIPGGAIEPFYNALANSRLEIITCRRECGAGFAADGYARQTDNLGVCVTTSGPGATNLLTAAANAQCDGVPMLVITAQPHMSKFGSNALQDSSPVGVDTVSAYQAICAFSAAITHPSQVYSVFRRAIKLCHEGNVCHISIPSDIQLATVPVPEHNSLFLPFDSRPLANLDYWLEPCRQMLEKAQRPCLYLGPGYLKFADDKTIPALAQTFGCSIVTSPSAKSLVDNRVAGYCGVAGFAGHARALTALTEADFVLSLGHNFAELEAPGTSLTDQAILHLDKDDRFSHLCWPHAQKAFGDVGRLLRNLVGDSSAKIERSPPPAQLIPASENGLPPRWLFEYLSSILSTNTVVNLDAGNAWAWHIHHSVCKAPNQHRIAFGLGTMGWSIGASIGTQVGDPKRPVVCVTGDGAFLMSVQELSTAVQLALPVVFIVLNDSGYGMVKHGQRMSGAAAVAFQFPETDYACIARGFGAQGIRIDSAEQLAELNFNGLFHSTLPTVIDVRIDPEAIPPIGNRVRDINQQ